MDHDNEWRLYRMTGIFIKESQVWAIEGREAHCNGNACGYWRGNNDHSNGPYNKLRMFKVNGEQICEGCLEDWAELIKLALSGDGY